MEYCKGNPTSLQFLACISCVLEKVRPPLVGISRKVYIIGRSTESGTARLVNQYFRRARQIFDKASYCIFF